MTNQVQSTQLANGLTVLTEYMAGLRSVTAGIWLRHGSRNETPALNGISHFIEHTVFKGTQRRTAREIANETDRLGGHIDAYTSHEMTGFAMKVVDTMLPQAFDLLSDMLCHPRFDEEDLQREQKVIIEEMKMIEDTPEEFLAERFHSAYFPNHSLGRPIEGTAETVASFDQAKTVAFHEQRYAPANLVIAAAGNVAHDTLVEMAVAAFGETSDRAIEAIEPEAGPFAAAPILVERKTELEQAHLILATPWPSAKSEDRYAASMLASLMGGGTSSRLWQSVREERGLAYSIGAGGNTYTDVGIFNIYAGASPSQIDEVLELSLAELRRIVRETVAEEELDLVKQQAIASILLSLESTSSRAGALARQEIIHGRRIPSDEIIRKVEAVTPEDIRRIAQQSFSSDSIALGALGNLNGFHVDRARLEI